MASSDFRCKDQRIAIIGQGVAGLVAALEAYKIGVSHIIRVEGREVCSRDQIIRLDDEILDYFKKNFGDLFNNLLNARILTRGSTLVDASIFNSEDSHESHFVAMELKDLEFLIDSVLNALQQNYPEEEGLTSYVPYKLIGMQGEETKKGLQFTCKIKNTQHQVVVFEVNKVLACDGIKSTVCQNANLSYELQSNEDYSGVITFPNIFSGVDFDANHFLPEVYLQGAEKPVDYIHINFPLRLAEQVLAQREKGNTSSKEEESFFRGYHEEDDRNRREEQLKIASEGIKRYRKELKDQWQWKKIELPINRFFYTESTLYLGVDVPEDSFKLMSEENKKPLQERVCQRSYFSKVLSANFPQAYVEMLMPLMRSSFVFQSVLYQSSYPTFKEAPGLILLGDAYANAQFQTGSGALKAIYDAIDFGDYLRKCFKNPQKSFPRIELEYHLDKRAQEIRRKAFDLGIVKKING